MPAIAAGAFLVLIGSYGLILWLRCRLTRPQKIEEFLFEGNRPLLAVSSGIGAMFSYSLAGTALLAAGYVFGWQICAPIILGASLSLMTYLRLLKNPSVAAIIGKFRLESFSRGASYPQAIAETAGKELHFVTLAYLFFSYAAMVSGEFAVIRVTLETVLPSDSQLPQLLLVLLIFVCFSYVFAGGFFGILISDHFQLLVIVFFVASATFDLPWCSIIKGVPGPFDAVVNTSGILQLALLASAFIGSFGIILGNLDHWYRSIGTLSPSQAKRVLTTVTITTTVAGVSLVILGSSAYTMGAATSGVGYNLSLVLLSDYASNLNSTSLLFLGMTLAAIGLTTLDTYFITLQQIYYEISVFAHAERFHWYLPEYLTKTKAVRAVGGLTVLASFGVSYLVPEHGIYAWGTLAIGSVIPLSPLLVLRALDTKSSYAWKPQVYGLLISCILAPFAYIAARSYVLSVGGSPTDHIYLIVVALGAATLLGQGLSILAWKKWGASS